MKLKQRLAKSALAAGIGVAAFGLAGGLASAQPYVPTPPPIPPIPDAPCVPTPDEPRVRQLRRRRRSRRSRHPRSHSELSEKTMIPSLSALQRRGVRLHHLRSVLVSLAKNRQLRILRAALSGRRSVRHQTACLRAPSADPRGDSDRPRPDPLPAYLVPNRASHSVQQRDTEGHEDTWSGTASGPGSHPRRRHGVG